MEFAENLVLRLMEDPKERDKKFRDHVYAVKDSSVGMPRSARCRGVGIRMTISSSRAMSHPSESQVTEKLSTEWFRLSLLRRV
ncbi:hypothetical protein NL676_032604 [Syzygium grande]|nr:hypothetical protein NL676_032604 [Syzygium grande]